MSETPVQPEPRTTPLQAASMAVLLATAAGTYFLVIEHTRWDSAIAMLVAIAAGILAFVLFALAYFRLKVYFFSRSGAGKKALADFMTKMDADRKELGLDKEDKAFAEKDVQEVSRKLREIELTPVYMKASESERDRMMKEFVDRHLKETEARVHEAATRATERIEALREYRTLARRDGAGEPLSVEDRERMKRLKSKAYSG